MLIVVVVRKIEINNNNLNRRANLIPILQKGTLRLKEVNLPVSHGWSMVELGFESWSVGL